jgi:hypothetical protein
VCTIIAGPATVPDDAEEMTKRLHNLIDQVNAIQQTATQLVVDLTDYLQRSIWLHTDTVERRGYRRGKDRRRKQRP